jgi:hypothetical protein
METMKIIVLHGLCQLPRVLTGLGAARRAPAGKKQRGAALSSAPTQWLVSRLEDPVEHPPLLGCVGSPTFYIAKTGQDIKQFT